jgi:iron complex outermembrane receptor protein
LLEPFPSCGRTRALALVVAAALGAQARADDRPAEDAPVELPEVVVHGERNVDGIVRPTGAATIVPAERYEGEAKGVAELLAAAPGVAVTRHGARGQLATVQIRGVASSGVKVLLDGLPVGSVGSSVDLATLPRAWVERLEVVRGPSAADVGAGALGGAVNVVTRGATADAAMSAELTAGSFGTYALSGERTGRVGALSLLAGVTAEATEGDFPYLFDDRPTLPGSALVPRLRENDASRRGGLLVKLGGPLGGTRLDAFAHVAGGRRGLPGSPYQPTPGDWMDDGRALVMGRVAFEASPSTTVAARLFGRADLLDVGLGTTTTRQRGGAAGAHVEARLAHRGGSLAVAVEAGGEGYGSAALGGSRTRAILAASVEETWIALPGRLRLSPAVRAERVGAFDGLSARLGAALRLLDGISLRASAGRTLRVPSFAELWLEQGLLTPNPALVPEVGTGADAAVAYEGRLGVAAVGGHATVYDELITYEGFTRFKPFNTGRALATGLEAELATAPARRLLHLSAHAAYAFLHTEFLRAPPGVLGNALPHRPRHRLQARIAVAPGPLGAHVEARLARDAWRERTNQTRVPDETLFSAGGFVRIARAPRLSLHVEVENLGDDRTLQDDFGQPLPGRTLMVSLRAGTSKEGQP